MAIKTQKYKASSKNSGQKIRAVRVTERNIEELREWSNKAPNIKSAVFAFKQLPGDKTEHKLTLHVAGLGLRVVRPGDYLFKNVTDDGKTTLEVYPSKKEFFESIFVVDGK